MTPDTFLALSISIRRRYVGKHWLLDWNDTVAWHIVGIFHFDLSLHSTLQEQICALFVLESLEFIIVQSE